jgi:hypothetical protein
LPGRALYIIKSTMNRWAWFSACAILGLAMLICGLLLPAHLRAVDASVIERAGRNTPALVEEGLALAQKQQLGAARLVLQAAEAGDIPHREKLALAVDNLAAQQPGFRIWGGVEPRWAGLFGSNPQLLNSDSQPFTEFVVRIQNREKLLEFLRSSPTPAMQELLRCRALTNTVLLPPSQSSSGQAFDAAVSIGGLLIEEGHLTVHLRDEIFALATEANRGGNPRPLEQMLLDLLSLGQRFNWGQLVAFTSRVEDDGTLQLLADQVRKAGAQLPSLFSAVQLSGRPADVAKYLADFSQTGLKDAGASLRFGTGGLNELLRRDQRLHDSSFQRNVAGYVPFGSFFRFALDYCWLTPKFAMGMKWFLYLCGGFLIAVAAHFARPAVSVLERPLQVRGIHVAREILFALGFLLVVLLLSEPFLAQESQKVAFHFRLGLPTTGSAVSAGNTGAHPTSLMNPSSLLTLLLFFVLQGLIYVACLVKLAEIRRQKVPSRIKLKLLENEDHLFDAGLYLGFVGTIISLILVSLGVIKFSLMAGYSSTSFGIIFVCVFKIFHLRPTRRKLLLESEAIAPEAVAPAQASAFATFS